MRYEYFDELPVVRADVQVPRPAERDQECPRVCAFLEALQLGRVMVLQLFRTKVTVEHLP